MTLVYSQIDKIYNYIHIITINHVSGKQDISKRMTVSEFEKEYLEPLINDEGLPDITNTVLAFDYLWETNNSLESGFLHGMDTMVFVVTRVTPYHTTTYMLRNSYSEDELPESLGEHEYVPEHLR